MYAIVRDGCHQLRVEEGQTLRLAYRGGAEPGQTVDLDQVLLLAEGDSVTIGAPLVEGAKVTTRVKDHGKDRKIVVYKYKRRKNVAKKQGHRQRYSRIRVTNIEA